LAHRELLFANRCKGWIIGTVDDKNKVSARQLEHRTFAPETGLSSTPEAIWQTWVDKLLRRLKRRSQDLIDTPKSADWKRAIALVMKAKTPATHRWLGETLHMGSLHEVSRQVSAWARKPDEKLLRKLRYETNHKA
jgi:hypothetical protein